MTVPSALQTDAVHTSTSVAAAVAERLAVAGCVAAEEEADELVAAAPDEDVLDGWVRRRGIHSLARLPRRHGRPQER
jgi:hypothetical protein